MSCYKCHTDHYRIYFNHHHTFLIASFFLLLLTFFILNRNSFTFGSFTLVTGILKYSFPFFVLKHNYYFGFWFCFAWLGFGCEGCSGQQWWWRKEAKNETFCPFFDVFFFILADIREIILTWIHFGSVLQSSLPTGEW